MQPYCIIQVSISAELLWDFTMQSNQLGTEMKLPSSCFFLALRPAERLMIPMVFGLDLSPGVGAISSNPLHHLNPHVYLLKYKICFEEQE